MESPVRATAFALVASVLFAGTASAQFRIPDEIRQKLEKPRSAPASPSPQGPAAAPSDRTPTAPAPVEKEVEGVARNLGSYAITLNRAKKTLQPFKFEQIKFCREDLASARAAGTPGTSVLRGSIVATDDTYAGLKGSFKEADGRTSLRFADADQICDGLDSIKGLVQARVDVEAAAQSLHWLGLKPNLHADQVSKLQEDAKACSAAVATLSGAGITKLDVSKSGQRDPDSVAVSSIESTYCAPLVAGTKGYAGDVAAQDKAEKEWWDRESKKYKAVGMGGAKLDIAMDREGRGGAIYGIGGRELVTPKEKQAASVWFLVWFGDYRQSDRDRSVTIRRYQFNGNAKVGEQQREYVTHPGPGGFR